MIKQWVSERMERTPRAREQVMTDEGYRKPTAPLSAAALAKMEASAKADSPHRGMTVMVIIAILPR